MNLFCRFIVKSFSIFYPKKVYGKENIPQGKALLVCNHFRALDCGYIASIYNKDIRFLAKKEIVKNKLVGKIVKSFGAVPIDRENPELKTMLSVIKYLKAGHKVCIFPEGTRNKSGTNELQETKPGYIVFAISASCPIVPIIQIGKGKLFKRQKFIIGKPIEFTEYYGKKLDKETINKLNEIVRENLLNLSNILSDIKKKKCK